MRSWPTPTPEQVSRAVASLVRAEQRRYFFDQLQSPAWLRPLAARGFFKDPPPAIRDEAKGSIGYPPWPEGAYLARMAESAPDDVLEIIQQIPEADNERVREHLIDAALAMPPRLAGRLVSRIRKWLEQPQALLLAEKSGQLMARLARGGEGKQALQLARSLLAVVPDRRDDARHISEEMVVPRRPQPVVRFDDWEYGEIIRRDVPVLVEAVGDPALTLVMNLLEAAIKFSHLKGIEAKPHDDLIVWRPAIEAHEQNGPEDVRTILVDAVRDSSIAIVELDASKLTTVVSMLEERGWFIFRRIALHLLTRFPGVAPDLVAARLTDRTLFDEVNVRHEYAALLRTSFRSLAPDEQATILGWIEWGPNLIASGIEVSEGEQSSEEHDERNFRYAQLWARDRLAWIGDGLPSEWAQKYQELVEAFGEPEHPDFATWSSGGFVGPRSPKTADELRAMPAAAVARYLRQWKPPTDEFMGPSVLGLARVLATVVAERPMAYALVATDFRGLDPTYVRELLRGLREALKAGLSFGWQPVLNLCRRIVTAPWAVEPRASDDFERDANWSPANQSVAELLTAGFENCPGSLPIELRSNVWQILLPLTDDHEPDQAYEATYGGSNMDPLTLSINTVRGEAMHAVVHYASWVRRAADGESSRLGSVVDSQQVNGLPPEVQGVLERHLDPSIDPSLTVRAVYGQWIPWLVMLDEPWVRANLERIFPSSPEERSRWDATWETYLFYSRLFTNVFETLRSEYERAIDRIGTWDVEARHRADPDDRLAEHLALMYWWGQLTWNEAGGLLERFYTRAPVDVRRHALDFIGRNVWNPSTTVEVDTLPPLQELWERRLKAVTEAHDEAAVQELEAFGWWFASGRFEASWAMAQLLSVLRLGSKLVADRHVMKQLAKTVDARPVETLECLRLLAERDSEGWIIYGSREEARVILATAMASPDVGVRQQALDLIDWFGQRGFGAFRDLR